MVIKGLLATWAHHVNYSYYTTKSNDAQRALYDIRDGNTYTVRKLADGNCWMTDNLRLDLSTNVTLTENDTALISRTSWTPDHATQPSDGIDWGFNNLQSVIDTARSYHNSTYGNLYNWYAATASSGNYNLISGDAADSICPKGWKLPQSSSGTASWNNLLIAYSLTDGGSTDSLNKVRQFPISLVLGGYYLQDAKSTDTDPAVLAAQGHVYNQNNHGHFWSSTTIANNHTYVKYLYVNNDANNKRLLVTNHYKDGGRSIRCVAQ